MDFITTFFMLSLHQSASRSGFASEGFYEPMRCIKIYFIRYNGTLAHVDYVMKWSNFTDSG